jgi:uncharacterized protein YdhG (YjbR/CyaY superfamily)
MVQSRAATVAGYLAELPPERRKVVAAVRKTVRANLPKGYVESMNWGMIAYEIPLSRYPLTYNRQPLMYAALAAQKNNFALYLTGVHGNPEMIALLKEAYRRAGLKLDMGKSCLRFKGLDQIPLDAIGRLIGRVPVDEFIRRYEKVKRPK